MEMPIDLTKRFVLAVSTRSLFDLAKENFLFETEGSSAFNDYQIKNEDCVLGPGTAFPLVRSVLSLNKYLPEDRQVEVVIASRNSPAITHRVSNSIRHYALPISRQFFTGGNSVVPYLATFKTDLFLSACAEDVELAVHHGVSAAMVYGPPRTIKEGDDGKLRIAFDGDAVVFDDESEIIYKQHGVNTFHEHEKTNARRPMKKGPMARVLWSIARLQQLIKDTDGCVRTSLVTARNAPAHERALRTLQAWRITVDEACFLGGVPKAEILRAFDPHIFFDDQSQHCAPACTLVPTAQVPSSLVSLTRDIPQCPKCQSPMVKRLAEKGKNSGKPFYGCSNYPKCNATLPLP